MTDMNAPPPTEPGPAQDPTAVAVTYIPDNIRAALALRGFPQHQAAALLNMSEHAFGRRMADPTKFKAGELLALAAWLDVRPGYFAERPTLGGVR
jgi:hypothetical protein